MSNVKTYETHRIVKNASIMAAATFLSRILGFVRDAVVAFALGAGPLADAFFVAFRLPNLFRRLFAEGSLTLAFIPVYTQVLQENGSKSAATLARSVLVWLLLILLPLVVLVCIFARPVTLLIAPGFAAHPEAFIAAQNLVRICFPYIFFLSGVALCMGILNSHNRFFAPAFSPCLLNLCMIGGALLAVWGEFSVAYSLAWSVVLAGFLQWIMQQPSLRQIGFRWRGAVELKSVGVRKIGALMTPTIFGAAVYQITILVGTILASFLPQGSISYLYYADRLVQFPLGIFGVAISAAALPSLATLAVSKRQDDFAATLNDSLCLTLFIALPAAGGLMGLAEPCIDLLFGRGAFGEQAVRQTAFALVAYAVGLPVFSCLRTVLSAFYALKDTKTPVMIAAFCLVVHIALSVVLMQILAHTGLALATTLSSALNVLLLVFFLRRRVPRVFAFPRRLFVYAVLSVLIFAVCFFLQDFGRLSLLSIPVLAILYFVLTLYGGCSDALLLWRPIARRLFGKKA